MKSLSQGANVPVPGNSAEVALSWSPERIGGLEADASAFLLGADGKVSSDADMVFYNQPASACGSVRFRDGRFHLDLSRVPASVARIAFAATIHGAEGTGTSFGKAVSAAFEVAGIARYEAATAGMTETALILGEVYRRDGAWKAKAVGQGFAGGLGPLARHFGVDVDEAPAATPTPPAPPVSASRVNLEKRLVDLAKRDPGLVSLVKKVEVSLAKKRLVTDRAKVALVLDISISMDRLYASGKMQHFVERAMALGYRFDEDGQIDVFLFGGQDHAYGTVGVDSYRGFVSAMLRHVRLEGSTYYGKVMRRVRAHYRSQPDWGDMPVFVMFVTDGATQDEQLSAQMIKEASREPIFWCFMAIGEARQSVFGASRRPVLPRGFDFLQSLDDMPGRLVDNANFFSVADPSAPSDEEMFDLLTGEFPEWQEAASKAGLFRNAGG